MANQTESEVLSELKSDHLKLGEKYKKLNNFLRQTDRAQLESILSSLQPKTDTFSSRIKIEIADSLKSNPNIIIQEAFLSEHKLLLGRGLQCKWIFEDESPLSDVVKLGEVIQSVSFACRVKLIGRLGRYLHNESKSEEIYKYLEESYGLQTASPLLPNCSSEFVREVLGRNGMNLNLGFRQLCQLENKDVDILMMFLNQRMEKFKAAQDANNTLKTDKYNKILIRILKNHPEKFLYFYEKHGNMIEHLNIGTKSSKHLIKHFESRINLTPVKFLPAINMKQIMIFLSIENLREIFGGILPKNLSEFRYIKNDVLGELSLHFPEDIYWQDLKLGFKRKYKEDLEDFLELIPPNVLQYIHLEQRIKIANLKLANPKTDEYFEDGCIDNPEAFWWKFHPTQVSIPKIKGILHGESDSDKRAEIISFLVDTCALNKDMVAFREICGWVVERYRNDSHTVMSKFLESIHKNIKIFAEFIKDWNWVAFEALFTLCIQTPTEPHPPHLLNLLMIVIQYRLEKDLPMDNFISVLVQVSSKIDSQTIPSEFGGLFAKAPIGKQKSSNGTIFEMKSRSHQVKLINMISAGLEKKYPEAVPLPLPCLNFLASLLKTIGCWNKDHKKQEPIRCADFSWLMNRINDFLVKSYTDTSSGEKSTAEIHLRIHLMEYLNKQPELRSKYFPEYLESIPDIVVIEFNQNRSPKTILDNLTSILEFNSKSCDEVALTSMNRYEIDVKSIHQKSKERQRRFIRFFERLPFHGYQQLVDLVVKHANSKITTGNSKIAAFYLNLLAVLDPHNQYSKFTESMCADSSNSNRIDLTSSSDAPEEYSNKIAIASSLRYMTPASIGLCNLSSFCTGDYLKLSLGSLYSLCIRSNAVACRKFLQPMIDQPAVSIKKHAIRLLCLHKSKAEILELLSKLWTPETHVSIRHVIIHQAIRITANTDTKNQKPYWDFFQSLLTSLLVTDKVVLRDLVGINYSRRTRISANIANQIPTQYSATYFQICLEKYGMTGVADGQWVDGLFLKIAERMDKLPEEFLKKSVAQQIDTMLTLEESYYGHQSNLVKFITKFLSNCPSEICLQSRLDTIWEAILKLKKEDTWDSKGKDGNYPAKQIAKTILDRICYSSLYKPEGCSDSHMDQVLEYFCEKLRNTDDRKLRTEFFNEFILLQLAKILHAQKIRGDWAEVSGKIAALVSWVVAEYHGEIIIGPFCTILKTFMEYYDTAYGTGSLTFWESEEEGKIALANGLLELENPPRSAVIVAASILSEKCPSKPRLAEKYLQVKQDLQNWPDETVQIFLAMS